MKSKKKDEEIKELLKETYKDNKSFYDGEPKILG